MRYCSVLNLNSFKNTRLINWSKDKKITMESLESESSKSPPPKISEHLYIYALYCTTSTVQHFPNQMLPLIAYNKHETIAFLFILGGLKGTIVNQKCNSIDIQLKLRQQLSVNPLSLYYKLLFRFIKLHERRDNWILRNSRHH